MSTRQALVSDDSIMFGDIPPAIDALLQEGVRAHRKDPDTAETIFRTALSRAPECLPVYYCLYKVLTYRGRLSEAQMMAESGLARATAQADLPPAWQDWRADMFRDAPAGAARFALYTLKALAFIALKADTPQEADLILMRLRELDPSGAVGWPVISDLAAGLKSAC